MLLCLTCDVYNTFVGLSNDTSLESVDKEFVLPVPVQTIQKATKKPNKRKYIDYTGEYMKNQTILRVLRVRIFYMKHLYRSQTVTKGILFQM